MGAERSAYKVAAVNPFWRFAVALDERADLPAVPFMRRAQAVVFAEECRDRFPERTVVLLRRRLFGRIDVELP